MKQIKVPYVFDGEHRSALHSVHWNWASSRSEEEVSWIFSSYSRNLLYILELQWGISFIARVCSAVSGLMSSYEGPFRNLLEALKGNSDASRSEAGDQGSLSTCHSDIGIPINFRKIQGSSPFEALNSTCLLMCQRDVSSPVQMRRGPRAFLRVSTGDSANPSYCEIKDVLPFKPLQANPALF